MPPVKGQKQKRGDARRKKILAAALEQFAFNGYNGTSLAAVAEVAGISAPGVLHHFESKEALLFAVIDEFDNRHLDQWSHIQEAGGVAALRLLPSLATDLLADTLFTRLLAVLGSENLDSDDLMNSYFVRRYRVARRWVSDLIRAGQQSGEIRDDVDATILAAQILAVQDGALAQHLLDGARIDAGVVYESFIEMVIRDIAVYPAPKNGRDGVVRRARKRVNLAR